MILQKSLNFLGKTILFFLLDIWGRRNKSTNEKEIVSKKFNPDGFNIGINIGEKAGQTVNHVHIHLIPRYD